MSFLQNTLFEKVSANVLQSLYYIRNFNVNVFYIPFYNDIYFILPEVFFLVSLICLICLILVIKYSGYNNLLMVFFFLSFFIVSILLLLLANFFFIECVFFFDSLQLTYFNTFIKFIITLLSLFV